MIKFKSFIIYLILPCLLAGCGVKRDMATQKQPQNIDKYNKGKIIINEPRDHY